MTSMVQSKVRSRFKTYAENIRGAAAAEFALVLAVFTMLLMNVTDLGIYVYDYMQVGNAGQALGQEIWALCPTVMTPVSTTCLQSANSNGTLTTSAMDTAVAGTSLGTKVSYKDTGGTSTLSEGWYCVNGSGKLTLYSSDMSTTPSNCSSGGGVSNDASGKCTNGTGASISGDGKAPGDYVCFTVRFTYAPMFGAATVASLLPTSITRTVWVRVN